MANIFDRPDRSRICRLLIGSNQTARVGALELGNKERAWRLQYAPDSRHDPARNLAAILFPKSGVHSSLSYKYLSLPAVQIDSLR
ncbi:MAG: hypothetical protein JWM54_1110 [Acidobacteriaceae bacterium]|nr:hypothetical protein [Acidobacteriaceae bacterium]